MVYHMDGLEQDRRLLQALCDFAGLTPSRLAMEAGLAATTILRPFNGTTTSRLSAPTLQKLQERFPEFTAWADYGVVLAPPALHPDLVEIDEVDLRYGMGATYLDVPVTAERRVFSRSWLRNFTRAAPELLFWAAGDGDSMQPTIRSGEIVLIDTSQKTVRTSGNIWAVAIGEIGMIRRIHVTAKGRFQLISEHGNLPPEEIGEDDALNIIGRVIAVVRRL